MTNSPRNDVAKRDIYEGLNDHTMVTDKEMFPYVVAVLKMASYLSAGAMISDSWILTAADALYLVRETIRELRVRIGSVNYKKHGSVLPVKYFRIHPYFDDSGPSYDLALVRLAEPAPLSPNVYPIRLRRTMRELTATHFIVTAWPPRSKAQSSKSIKYNSLESIQRNRLLTVRQMHPMDPEDCRKQQEKLDIMDNGTLLCLDSSLGSDPCAREAGAPVVLNGVLWGIVSSWRPEDCKLKSGPSFVNLVASPNVSSWIDAVERDLHWRLQRVNTDEDNYV
ncbi:unnamed protein product, partial [Iphiclides podalirius]